MQWGEQGIYLSLRSRLDRFVWLGGFFIFIDKGDVGLRMSICQAPFAGNMLIEIMCLQS